MNDRKNIRVAVIIAVYNAEPFLEGCFNTLEKADKENIDLKVIVVDDKSPDRSSEIIATKWPWVEIIRLKENRGFAGANNVGMEKALDWGADYIYLLNQDTEVDSRFLEQAVKVAEDRPTAGSVQSLLLLHPDRDLVNSWGNTVHFLGFGYSLGYRRPKSEVEDRTEEIVYASGAAALFRADALRRVGLFDEDLFMYHEDLDLGWRLRLNGWKNILAPRSVVYHKYEFSRSISKFFFMERNRYLVLFQNLRSWSLIVLFPWLLLSEIALFVLAIKGGWWREKGRVYGYLLNPKNWKQVDRKRHKIADIRRLGDRAIVKDFASVIEFQDFTGPFVEKVANPIMRFLWVIIRPLII
jgi:GT2 family glycosyltransferase